MTKEQQRKINEDIKKDNYFKKRTYQGEWYSIRSLIGNCPWAIFFALLGGREAGKSYAVTHFFVDQWKRKKRPFYWLRLTEASQRKLLTNNAEKLIDPDIRRSYNLDIETKGDGVYEILERDEKGKPTKKALMGRVLALSTFYNDKGSGFFDKDFLNDPNMWYNLCLDEMNREANEKNTFDILYAFVNQLENLVRSTKTRIRVFLIGNTLQEASDIMCGFNFIPEHFGRYYIRKKRCVIDYIEPSAKYLERRKGTIADILLPECSTFTNEIATDKSVVSTEKFMRPLKVIKFSKDKKDWFTVWDGNKIAKFNGEKQLVIAMRPYLDEIYNNELMTAIVQMFDSRIFKFKDLITFKMFQKCISELKPRKNG